MPRRHVTTEAIDLFGKRLLESGKPDTGQLDRLAAKRDLFAGVLQRINAEEASPAVVRPPVAVLNWRYAAVTAAAAVIFTASWLSMGLQQIDQSADALVKQRQSITAAIQASTAISPPAAYPAAHIVRQSAQRRQHAVAVATARPGNATPDMSGFYALTYDDDGGDDVRMIRVELPRSSVVAMGLAAHLENESDKIKADLLIGSDGVARAVRLAK